MPAKLTEDLIRSLCSAQSFQRGYEYYRVGAIYNTARQGNVLTGECEGSTAPSYRLQVELDEGGVRSASCTCPFDWGGFCKHIVALLLSYINQPEEFIERKELAKLLAGLDREALVGLVSQMVARDPELYDWLEMAIPATEVSTKRGSSQSGEKRATQVSEQAYRRQVKNILRSARGGYDDEYGGLSDLVEQLDEVSEAAAKFLEAGDPESALVILKVLLDEVVEEYESFYDEGELAGFVDSLGMPLAEAILSIEWDEASRAELLNWLEQAINETSDYSDDGLDVAKAAVEYGWDSPPPVGSADEEDESYAGWEEADFADWELTGDELTQAQLNVLERQGRMKEFLELCQRTNSTLRYALKLLDLDRKDEAMLIVMNQPVAAGDSLVIAQKLRSLGYLPDALLVGERGLSAHGQKYALAAWLAPLEEAQGHITQALQAYQVAFDASPSFELYKTLQRLSGINWKALKPSLLARLHQSNDPSQLADVFLYEKDWESAIYLAEKSSWDYTLLEKVAEAMILHRPEWVIRVSIQQAEGLIVKTQSNLYPAAARWLSRAKKAYQQQDRQAEWEAYIVNLRATYVRRPALQKELKGL